MSISSSLFATMLIYVELSILRWSVCKRDVAPVFFKLHVVSKSPAEICTPIGAVLELRSRSNLPCLVNLALCLSIISRTLHCVETPPGL